MRDRLPCGGPFSTSRQRTGRDLDVAGAIHQDVAWHRTVW
jgi:hypothetical protein